MKSVRPSCARGRVRVRPSCARVRVRVMVRVRV